MTLDIDRRADLWGDRTAVIDHTGDREWSYAELSARAGRVADRLGDQGADPGDAVAVVSRNRPELLALFFGARRRGATTAPVSHRLPRETVASLLDRIDPAVVVAEERFEDLLPDDVAVRPVEGIDRATDDDREADGDPGDRGGQGRGIAGEPTGEHSPLYLHTGGTTGVPKVVVVSDRQVEWNCITEAAAWGLGKGTVAPVLLPLFHTGGWNLLTLPTLYVGGTVVLQRAFDPDEALATIEAHGATQVFGVAAIFRAMAESDRFEATDFSTVEWFMSGGGPTPESVMAAYWDRGERFVQGYGLTEGGPNDLYFEPDRFEAFREKPDSVGRPFPDCSIRVVGDDGTPVDAGEVGELEVSGPITADRYLETEDGTFEGEWVSTGDLVRRDADGDVFVVGRTDNMFVSGGENVYPEAVEATLDRHPTVAAAGVVGAAHERWGRVPKAVVVPGDGGEGADGTDAGAGRIDPDELVAFARERLADHEVPREVEVVDELPESGPGKLDREALDRRYGSGSTGGERDPDLDSGEDRDPDPDSGNGGSA